MTFAKSIYSTALTLATGAFASVAASAAPMTFRTIPVGEGCGSRCARMIVAEGEITTSTPDRFLEFVRRSGHSNTRSVILLHSQGGRVGAAMQLGRHFRQTGMAAIVARAGTGGITSGACYSACVYALIGATKRVVPPTSRIGVHRMAAYDRAGADPEELPHYRRVYATPDLVKRLSDYAGAMGVSRDLVSVAERVSHDRLRIVTQQEIRRWRLGVAKF